MDFGTGGDSELPSAEVAEQRGQDQARRPGPEQQHARPGLELQNVQAPEHAGHRLGEHGHLRIKIIDSEAAIDRGHDVLGEPTGRRHALLHQVFTERRTGPPALGAAAAGGGVVDRHPMSDQAFVTGRAGGDHLADELVSGDQRIPRSELTVVQVPVGAADARGQDLQQHLAGRRLRHRQFPNLEGPGPLVHDGPHGHHALTLRSALDPLPSRS